MKTFVVVMKVISGENKGKLIVTHLQAESKAKLERLLSIWHYEKPVLISEEW